MDNWTRRDWDLLSYSKVLTFSLINIAGYVILQWHFLYLPVWVAQYVFTYSPSKARNSNSCYSNVDSNMVSGIAEVVHSLKAEIAKPAGLIVKGVLFLTREEGLRPRRVEGQCFIKFVRCPISIDSG